MRTLFTISIVVVFQSISFGQCTDYATFGTNSGTLTFDGNPAAYQTTGTVTEQDYWSFTVVCGATYNFDFCNNGGISGGLYPDFTLLNGTTVLASSLNGGSCGSLTWTSNYNGTAVLYITDNWDGCTSGPNWTAGAMAYNESGGGADPSFTLSATSCSTASATITGDTGGTFSFNPAPGDGATVNASTGAISNGTAGASYTLEYDLGCGTSSTESVTLSSSGDASFTLTANCGGAAATITGDVGGTFGWNPNPGDGAQVNATSGNVSNGNVGTTYYVEYTVCGTSNTESVTVIDDNCFTLNGDASYITVAGEQCIELTDAANNQTGCAWNSSLIDFGSDFSLSLDYYFGSNVGGADGTTFTFQPSSSTACGQSGAQLAGGGIANSLIVEFDTYDNDGGSSWDLSCDHIAVEIDGDLIDDPINFPANQAPLCGPVCAKSGGGNIDDGGTYEVEIAWDASTQELNIYFDGALRLTCNYDFVTNVFGGQEEVYWGATAATGGLNNQQYFCPSTIIILPVELTSFYSTCDNSTEIFTWVSASEYQLKEYILEYTYDGMIYFPERTIPAHGTTTVEHLYETSVFSSDSKIRYYRLKTVDFDGYIEYSDIIPSKRCNTGTNNLIRSASVLDGIMMVSLSDVSDLSVVDQTGRVITNLTQIQSAQIDVSKFAKGIYFLQASSIDGIKESLKISSIEID